MQVWWSVLYSVIFTYHYALLYHAIPYTVR